MYQLQYVFWTLAAICQAAVALVMWKRQLHRKYAAFFAYTVFDMARSLALFLFWALLNHHAIRYATYFTLYWSTDAVSVAFAFLLLYRAATNYFSAYPLAERITAAAFAAGCISLLIFNFVLNHAASGSETHRIILAILLLERSCAIIKVGLVAILFLCSRFMALPWRTDLSFGVCLGLAIAAALELGSNSVRIQLGPASNLLCSVVIVFGYLLAVAVWVVYIFHPQLESRSPVSCEAACADLSRWNQALKEVVTQ